ncbi:MAG: ABC transporter permease [Gemmatimonadales bacterium]
MSDFLRQIRQAVRRLLRVPLFTGVSVLTLAIGIGANAAIFSVVDGVLIKPLPYPESERLVSIYHEAPGVGEMHADLSQATYLTYREDGRSVEDLGIWWSYSANLTGQGEPERVAAVAVSDAVLPLIGARAVVGRTFDRNDDRPDAALVAMLSHGYWTRRFGGDPSVVGRNVTVDGTPYQVIGVLDPDTRLLELDASVWVTMRVDPATATVMNFAYPALGRLRSGAALAEVESELDRLMDVALERYPGPITREQLQQAGFHARVVPLKNAVVGEASTILWVLAGTVGLVLLLACANVANLFLVQAEARQREVALRTALGAGRRQLVAGFLLESAVLALAAGVVGLVIAAAGLELLHALGPSSLPRLREIGIDARVGLFTFGVSLLAAGIFGSYPAFRHGRAELQSILKEGGRAVGAARERHRVRNGLVVVQVALAMVLLIGSGLMVRSVQALRRVDPGFSEPERAMVFRLDLPGAEIREEAAVARFELQLIERLRAIPAVQAAGGVSSFTLSGELTNSNPIAVEGRPTEPGQVPPVRSYRFVGPGYHEALGVPLLAGRPLTAEDVETRRQVVVVNEALARAEFGSVPAALGQRIRDFLGSEWFEIVGVTASVHYDGMAVAAPATIYWPLAVENFWDNALWVPRSLDYVVRTEADPLALAGLVREAVRELNPNLPVANVRAVAEVLRSSMARPAFAMVMLSIAAAAALLLGLVGIYGVISYIVAERTQEIGVRIAIGADPGRVRRMVVSEATLVIGVGIGIGLLAAVGLTRAMGSLLYGVRPLDLVTYAVVTGAIGLVALLASYLPARRAARVDPVTALRTGR